MPGAMRNSNKTFLAPKGVPGCQDLLVRVTEGDNGVHITTSAWQPSREELARLNEGQPIHLHVYGNSHPMVALSVPTD